MIGDGRHSAQQRLGHPHTRRGAHEGGVDSRGGVGGGHGGQPLPHRNPTGAGEGAKARLEQVVVRIDQPRGDDAALGIQDLGIQDLGIAGGLGDAAVGADHERSRAIEGGVVEALHDARGARDRQQARHVFRPISRMFRGDERPDEGEEERCRNPFLSSREGH